MEIYSNLLSVVRFSTFVFIQYTLLSSPHFFHFMEVDETVKFYSA